ncbi:hypothetical protein GWK47_030324 [Chionoecetes opilio]|uniref:Uncharacterized protein n=1 Tax=Chionoecetes opilio TaxID=41210 RepID=A0A8J4YJS2_CHIOP|nr:hypothetical protein GWK47_030324 [Chionoecetes opilio]
MQHITYTHWLSHILGPSGMEMLGEIYSGNVALCGWAGCWKTPLRVPAWGPPFPASWWASSGAEGWRQTVGMLATLQPDTSPGYRFPRHAEHSYLEDREHPLTERASGRHKGLRRILYSI